MTHAYINTLDRLVEWRGQVAMRKLRIGRLFKLAENQPPRKVRKIAVPEPGARSAVTRRLYKGYDSLGEG